MLKNSDFKYPVYGTLDNPIHALNIYESIEHIKKSHPKGNFLAIDACLGSKTSIGNIQIREGPILPGKGVGKKLPQIGHYSIVGIVDKIYPFPPGHYYKDGEFISYRDMTEVKEVSKDDLETACHKIKEKLTMED